MSSIQQRVLNSRSSNYDPKYFFKIDVIFLRCVFKEHQRMRSHFKRNSILIASNGEEYIPYECRTAKNAFLKAQNVSFVYEYVFMNSFYRVDNNSLKTKKFEQLID